jgi:DNA-binding PadR family transcriptional regulator
MSSEPNVELLQGTLDLLILKALALGPLHGWAIAKRIQQMSRDVLTVNQGSLYPALYRLQDRGMIARSRACRWKGEDPRSTNKPPRKSNSPSDET